MDVNVWIVVWEVNISDEFPPGWGIQRPREFKDVYIMLEQVESA